jgi:hypothetical protein
MDPSGYGQTPPPPPPPPPDWSQPSPPDQPGQPDQPAPFGQPPYGQPPYGQPPYGQPAGMWAAPAPARRSRLPLIITGIVVLVIIAGAGLFALSYLKNHQDAGKVVFSTDKPVAGQTVGCSVDHQLTTVAAGTPVYPTYIFSSRQGSTVVSITVTKDGASYLPATEMPVTDTQGLDCFADTTDLSAIFQAGTYKFTLTSGGTTIAEGTLIVTP